MIQQETQSDTGFHGVSIVKRCMCNLREKVHGAVHFGVVVSAKIALKDLSFWNPQYYMSCWPQQ